MGGVAPVPRRDCFVVNYRLDGSFCHCLSQDKDLVVPLFLTTEIRSDSEGGSRIAG